MEIRVAETISNLEMNHGFCIRPIELHNAENIVKFQCRKTVEYLDLSCQEFSKFKKQIRQRVNDPTSFRYICREQSVQTSIQSFEEIGKRNLLQRFHLDLTRRRMCIFINKRHVINPDKIFDCIILYNLKAGQVFFQRSWSHFVISALQNNNNKERIIRKCLTLINYKLYPSLVCLDLIIVVFQILQAEIVDSQFIVDTIILWEFDSWIINESVPEQLDFFLHHAYTVKRGNELVPNDMISFCVAKSLHDHVRVILKFQDFNKISEIAYYYLLNGISIKSRNANTSRLQFDGTDLNRNARRFQAIIILHAFVDESEAASEMLRLMWRSLPDSYFTLEELQSVYKHTLTDVGMEKVQDFYTDIIGKHVPESQPRMLQHYCRVKIREVLSSKEILFNGIDELRLPATLKQYLKLQM